MSIVFEAFPKIARLKRECVITEKIDGTNAQIIITDDGDIAAASRSRLITPSDDNFGFAAWVERNREDLLQLGPGRHFGEWWGAGIQRKYGQPEKKFSLFNVRRFGGQELPECVGLVPVLYDGIWSDKAVEDALQNLRVNGSVAAPGFMQPEGVVVFHKASNAIFKVTIEKDEEPKGLREAGR